MAYLNHSKVGHEKVKENSTGSNSASRFLENKQIPFKWTDFHADFERKSVLRNGYGIRSYEQFRSYEWISEIDAGEFSFSPGISIQNPW